MIREIVEAEEQRQSDTWPEIEREGVSADEELREMEEQRRVQETVERLQGIPELQSERWSQLGDPLERKWALDRTGQDLERVYGIPRPPLLEDDRMPERLYGTYQDEEWLMKLNDQLLVSDDPREALETYLHEFRHAYQHQEVDRLRSPGRPDDLLRASEWERNLSPGGYKPAPPDILAVTDPARYRDAFDAYANQPVERDARDFARRILNLLY